MNLGRSRSWPIDRIDGKVAQVQILQGDEEGGPVRYYAEVPRKVE